MYNPCSIILELLGYVVAVGAWLSTLSATLMPQWRSLSTELLTMESYEMGLWEICVVQEVGGIECRLYETLLGLPNDIMLARVLMCLSNGLSLLGLILAIPGFKHVKSCQGEEGWRVKRGMKITAGVLWCLAGLAALVPVSYMAHDMVMKFFDHSVPEVSPRFEFGDAIFVGWGAGFLHVVAAFLFFASCLGMGLPSARLVYRQHYDEYKTANGPPGIRKEYV